MLMSCQCLLGLRSARQLVRHCLRPLPPTRYWLFASNATPETPFKTPFKTPVETTFDLWHNDPRHNSIQLLEQCKCHSSWFFCAISNGFRFRPIISTAFVWFFSYLSSSCSIIPFKAIDNPISHWFSTWIVRLEWNERPTWAKVFFFSFSDISPFSRLIDTN